MEYLIASDEDMKRLGESLGSRLRGGECIELVGDVGAGKTTLMKGIGAGLGVDEDVQSPSFTISRTYECRDDLRLEHYDFYRLSDAGIMSYEIAESLDDPQTIVAVEWAGTVEDVLPKERIIINLAYEAKGDGRRVTVATPEQYTYVREAVS